MPYKKTKQRHFRDPRMTQRQAIEVLLRAADRSEDEHVRYAARVLRRSATVRMMLDQRLYSAMVGKR